MLYKIFTIFFKLGFMAFGGGYSMISLVEREVVEKNKIMSKDKFTDIVSIAGGLPGAVGLNAAIFIGQACRGFAGAVVGMLASILPCLTIICAIMMLFSNISSLPLVRSAMYGIRPVVVALILYASYRIGTTAYKAKWYMIFTAAGFLFCLIFTEIPLPVVVAAGLAMGIVIHGAERCFHPGTGEK